MRRAEEIRRVERGEDGYADEEGLRAERVVCASDRNYNTWEWERKDAYTEELVREDNTEI